MFAFRRTANKFDSVESVDAAGLQDGEALLLHAAVLADGTRGGIPLLEGLAALGLVEVVEEAVLWHEERLALECSH